MIGCKHAEPLKESSNALTDADFAPLNGVSWMGKLTYLDYSSDQTVSILSRIKVSKVENVPNQWRFKYEYPKEPQANSEEIVEIKQNGLYWGSELVKKKHRLPDGALSIVTEEHRQDGNKEGIIRHTYLIDSSSFSIKKEVKYDDANEYFLRHKYEWAK
jgi:hypothetical protein